MKEEIKNLCAKLNISYFDIELARSGESYSEEYHSYQITFYYFKGRYRSLWRLSEKLKVPQELIKRLASVIGVENGGDITKALSDMIKTNKNDPEKYFEYLNNFCNKIANNI